MGINGDNIFSVVAKNIDVLAMPLVSLVFPLYCSIKAIETKSSADDQQWLTYWVLYSLITLFELTFAKLLEWFPIWSYTKLIGVCWLVLPYFNGAAYVYEHFVRPFYMNPQRSISKTMDHKLLKGSLPGLIENQEPGGAATQSFMMIMSIN
ncbi:hypothetical protein ABFX02_12G106600 [Erythranthe guttata]